jgi:uncharacterized protein YcfL
MTGAWQSDQVALAESQTADLPEAPLYSGLIWSEPAPSTQEIRINIEGDTVSLPGERYEALVQFPSGLPQEVSDYYSPAALADSGWASYDVFDSADGVDYVFYHESGTYVSVQYFNCPDVPSSICLAVWQSEQTAPLDVTPGGSDVSGDVTTAGDFGKISPGNGSTGLDPKSTKISWETYVGADKYKYCVKLGSACPDDGEDWLSTYNKSITFTNLAYDKTYYWQVKATTCELCVPKDWVYADDNTQWTFKTKSGTGTQVTILGNAGVGGAILKYTDGTQKQVTANTSGAYSLNVSYNWTGTVTPTKPGYIFTPASASFTNLTAPQTIQNFTVTAIYTISGNAGQPGVTLSYVAGTPKTVVSDGNGNYSIAVNQGWSGTVTPSKIGYVFTPANRTYANLSGNQAGQNYTATVATYTISGNAGAAGVTLSYISGTPKSVVSDGSGNYSIPVPHGWSGTVTPSKPGYIFTPPNRTYSNVTANQAVQDYTAKQIYIISGNADVAGVTLTYSDGSTKTVTSQVDGSYLLGILGGWTGTITPTHECFTFSPASRNYTNLASNLENQDFSATVKASCADVDVLAGGNLQGRFGLPSQGSTRASFAQLSSGPVQIDSTNALSLIAAERVVFKANNVPTSFSELMGLPNAQLDTTYWLPWYNNLELNTQLRIANVSNSTATVRLFIHGNEMVSGCSPSNSPYTLTAGASLRVSCNINNGPVKVESNQNIVVAERVVYSTNGQQTSYSEMMALPHSQVSTTFWLPWYNNVDLDTQLRFANVSSQPATVNISIAGQPVNGNPFLLQPGQSSRVSLGGISNGPVKIESNQNIVASERVIYKVNGVDTSYSEMMALPSSQVDTTYWLPWYNNTGDLDTQLRFANLNTTQQATVRIFIGGQEMNGSPFTLQPGQSTRVSLAGISDGPVEVQSTQDLIVAERVVYKVSGVGTSFTEMMALPNSQLDSSYWFPWYNNVEMDSQLRFGRP